MSLQLRARAEIERRRRHESGESADAYSTFKAKYRNDPAGFIRDCVKFRGDGATGYQLETASKLPEEKRVAVRGPHGLGKTALASWIILWFALTRDGVDDWKIPTTASAWRQLTKYLWPEVRKWARRLDWEKIGRPPLNDRTELLTLSLKLSTGEAFALTSNDVNAIEGAHATALLYVFDEAKAIPDDIWDGAEGAFASPETGEALALAISTPGEPQGRFYEIHAKKAGLGDWYARHVKVGEAIRAGRISKKWVRNRLDQWGAKSAVFQNRVLGNFASSEEDTVITLAQVEAANERWFALNLDEIKVTRVGVDVARSGADKTVLSLGDDLVVKELRRYSKQSTMETAGRVEGILIANPGSRAIVDVLGVGAGTVDRLRERDQPVLAFGAGERTDRRDKSGELGFADKRSAAWWALRELLESEPVALPDDDTLVGDLTAPKWRVMSGNKVKVESKEDIKKRIRRSTDDADAVIMQIVGPEFSDEFEWGFV